MTESISPCAVCGLEADLEEWQEDSDSESPGSVTMISQYQVVCGFCDANPPDPSEDRDTAIRRWNEWSDNGQSR
jgi:hypothetical protein